MRVHVRQLPLAVFLLVALCLRLWNAQTAFVHDDEIHYVADAGWRKLETARALDFLRDHPRQHDRLDQGTGELQPWGRDGRPPRLGHPTFYALLLGAMFAVHEPDTDAEAVRAARVFNSLCDSTVVLLLPILLTGLGVARAGALAGAALYAVYPPAVVYGSLAYLDPPLAPLFIALLIVLVRHPGEQRWWIVAGALSGLLVVTKQTGMIALLLAPIALLRAPTRLRAIGAWAVVTAVVVCLLVSPGAYAAGLLHPLDPYARLRPNPLHTLVANVTFLSRPYDYYWLSYARHGRPLASALAPLHHALTAPVLWLFAVSAFTTLAARRWRDALIIHLPVVLALLLLPPSDGAWRAHIVGPLVCAGAVTFVAGSRPWLRIPAVLIALALAAQPFVPARAAEVGLSDLLRANGARGQPYAFYDPAKGHPLVVYGSQDFELARRVWLRPGTYELGFDSSAPLIASVDGEPIFSGMNGATEFEVHGRLHELRLRFLAPGVLESLWMRPVGNE